MALVEVTGIPENSQYGTIILGLCIVHTPLGGVVEQVVAALEAVVEGGVAPRGNDLDLGVDRVEGKLEADLVVAKMVVRRSRSSRIRWKSIYIPLTGLPIELV